MAQPEPKRAMFGRHVVPTAKAVRWVREDVYLQVVYERDLVEGLLSAAERRIADLEHTLAEWSR